MAIFKQVESGINPYAEDYMATKIAYILRPKPSCPTTGVAMDS